MEASQSGRNADSWALGNVQGVMAGAEIKFDLIWKDN